MVRRVWGINQRPSDLILELLTNTQSTVTVYQTFEKKN